MHELSKVIHTIYHNFYGFSTTPKSRHIHCHKFNQNIGENTACQVEYTNKKRITSPPKRPKLPFIHHREHHNYFGHEGGQPCPIKYKSFSSPLTASHLKNNAHSMSGNWNKISGKPLQDPPGNQAYMYVKIKNIEISVGPRQKKLIKNPLLA